MTGWLRTVEKGGGGLLKPPTVIHRTVPVDSPPLTSTLLPSACAELPGSSAASEERRTAEGTEPWRQRAKQIQTDADMDVQRHTTVHTRTNCYTVDT